MKLYEVIRVYEARKNPEQNPKLSPVDQLRKYKDDPNIFISFKTVSWVHINPEYPFNTPAGVYFYPLQVFWQRHEADFEAGKMPSMYATNLRYIHVIKYNGKGKKAIRSPNDYTQSDLDHDLKELGKLGYNVDGIIAKLPHNQYTTSPFGQFWNAINVLTSHIKGQASTGASKIALAKNKIFRQLGYAYICEPTNGGVIHPNEPSQGFFLSGGYVKTVDRIDTQLKLTQNDHTWNRLAQDVRTILTPDDKLKSLSINIDTFEVTFDKIILPGRCIVEKQREKDKYRIHIDTPNKLVKKELKREQVANEVLGTVSTDYAVYVAPKVIEEILSEISTDAHPAKIEEISKGGKLGIISVNLDIAGTKGAFEITSRVDDKGKRYLKLYPFNGYQKYAQIQSRYLHITSLTYSSVRNSILGLFNTTIKQLHSKITNYSWVPMVERCVNKLYRNSEVKFEYNENKNILKVYDLSVSDTEPYAYIKEKDMDLVVSNSDREIIFYLENYASMDEDDMYSDLEEWWNELSGEEEWD